MADIKETSSIMEDTEETSKQLKRKISADLDESVSDPKRKDQGAIDPRSRQCPYLDTINRSVLDFDFEKLCSISLSHINCYACLVCGKYFQGRGQKSHAYTHSVLEGHHVFLNLETHKFYCLPDNYEVIDSSLDDIIYVLNPVFSPEMIRQMDTSGKQCIAFDGKSYLAGIVGLNNIKANDYCNVIMHALSHVTPVRNYFMREENYKSIKRPPGDQLSVVPHRFGELMRKLWNPRNFKTHVSPHEMLQAVVLCSKKKFQITKQGDPIDFMSWLLNALHASLNGGKKLSSSIINQTFRGKMTVRSRKIPTPDVPEAERNRLQKLGEYDEKVIDTQFLYLTCDLPPMPLYPDELKENIIPQVPLGSILAKFNGVTEKEYKTYKDSTMKKFEITKLPPYIIVFIKRFTKNQFVHEKNHTIVNFPIKNVDFGELLSDEAKKRHKYTHYDLLSNIVHDGEPKSGVYLAHVLHKGSSKWFEMQDLHVMDRLPQMIPLSESYIQVYELNKDIPNKAYQEPTKTQAAKKQES